jgi:hypothetical protein
VIKTYDISQAIDKAVKQQDPGFMPQVIARYMPERAGQGRASPRWTDEDYT